MTVETGSESAGNSENREVGAGPCPSTAGWGSASVCDVLWDPWSEVFKGQSNPVSNNPGSLPERWWHSCGRFHGKQRMGVSSSSARAGPSRPHPPQSSSPPVVTVCLHPPQRGGCPVPSQPCPEAKEKLQTVSSRHKLKMLPVETW